MENEILTDGETIRAIPCRMVTEKINGVYWMSFYGISDVPELDGKIITKFSDPYNVVHQVKKGTTYQINGGLLLKILKVENK